MTREPLQVIHPDPHGWNAQHDEPWHRFAPWVAVLLIIGSAVVSGGLLWGLWWLLVA